MWMAVQSESLGPAIELKPGYETFWAYIPHFIHSPFYVYAYAFGDCLVNSLYAVYEKSRAALPSAIWPCCRPAAPSIIPNCWRRSGSMHAIRNSGRAGLSVIERLIDELESAGERRASRSPQSPLRPPREVRQLIFRKHCHGLMSRAGFIGSRWK